MTINRLSERHAEPQLSRKEERGLPLVLTAIVSPYNAEFPSHSHLLLFSTQFNPGTQSLFFLGLTKSRMNRPATNSNSKSIIFLLMLLF